MIASIACTTLQIEPWDTALQTANKNVGISVDSGMIFSILNESQATENLSSHFSHAC